VEYDEKDYEAIYIEYSKQIMDHFLHPRNVGKIEDATAYAKVGDPSCGDYIVLFLKLDDNIISDIKYLVYGCAGAIATSSALSELVKGKTVEYALNVTDDDVVNYLCGLPENKKHCSLLGVRALHAALNGASKKDK
jgi:nitrogen fixation NifU-like protein